MLRPSWILSSRSSSADHDQRKEKAMKEQLANPALAEVQVDDDMNRSAFIP